MPTKLIITDDHGLLLDSLEKVLNMEPNLEVIGVANDGKELLGLMEVASPDIVILDIEMPEMDGIETTQELKKRYPEVKIIISTAYNTQVFVNLLIGLGVNGYILKKSTTEELLLAIEAVNNGSTFFGPGVNLAGKIPTYKKLTKSEIRVLRLTAQGLTAAQIASKLNNAVTTIETHKRNFMKKLDAKNMIDAIRKAENLGYLSSNNMN